MYIYIYIYTCTYTYTYIAFDSAPACRTLTASFQKFDRERWAQPLGDLNCPRAL